MGDWWQVGCQLLARIVVGSALDRLLGPARLGQLPGRALNIGLRIL
jgi:hypothetical protein